MTEQTPAPVPTPVNATFGSPSPDPSILSQQVKQALLGGAGLAPGSAQSPQIRKDSNDFLGELEKSRQGFILDLLQLYDQESSDWNLKFLCISTCKNVWERKKKTRLSSNPNNAGKPGQPVVISDQEKKALKEGVLQVFQKDLARFSSVEGTQHQLALTPPQEFRRCLDTVILLIQRISRVFPHEYVDLRLFLQQSCKQIVAMGKLRGDQPLRRACETGNPSPCRGLPPPQ